MPVGNGHTKNVVISRWNKALIIQPAIDIKVNEAGLSWTKSNMCKDAQALVCYRCRGSLRTLIISRGRGIRRRNTIEHLVCDKVGAVIPRLCVVGVWIGRRIQPSTDLECTRQTAGSAILVHA